MSSYKVKRKLINVLNKNQYMIKSNVSFQELRKVGNTYRTVVFAILREIPTHLGSSCLVLFPCLDATVVRGQTFWLWFRCLLSLLLSSSNWEKDSQNYMVQGSPRPSYWPGCHLCILCTILQCIMQSANRLHAIFDQTGLLCVAFYYFSVLHPM